MIYHKSKYRAQRVERDGIKFDSKKEAARYSHLLLLKKAGEVDFFLRQVPFHLPGGVKYLVDFMIFYSSGEMALEDVKGYPTALSVAKIKIVEDLYKVKINIV